MMALVPDTSTPAVPVSQMMEIAFVMVTPPKPPGSRQLISPPAAVFEMAPAKVLHGAVRLHGLASSPTPDTQVRVACAWALGRKSEREDHDREYVDREPKLVHLDSPSFVDV